MSAEKRFFAKHAKSSAALISLGIHAVLIVVALSFVAVTVITKEDKVFEAKPVSRPKMALKKLQVPVNIKKKKTQKPKLRKRIVVQPKLNQNMPDIKMPEITGVKGGLGSGVGGGLGGAGSLGFTMPEINIFGIKGRGEKVFLILDASDHMLVDAMGGILAYSVIKQEMNRIVEELPPTALFNICIFGKGERERILFPNMVPANNTNTGKVKAWLDPLNTSDDWSKSSAFGLKTLGAGGSPDPSDLRIGNFAKPPKEGGGVYAWSGDRWFRSAMIAMKQQADTIFLLTNDWGTHHAKINAAQPMEEWIQKTSAGKKWQECIGKAQIQFAEENKKRKAAGKPPRVVPGGGWGLMNVYYPDVQRPPRATYYNFPTKDFAEAFLLTRAKHEPAGVQTRSGLKKKKSKRNDFSFNVVQFVKENGKPSEGSSANFKKLTSLCNGEYKTIAGLDAIQSYVAAASEE